MTRPSGTVQYSNAGRVILVTGGANGIGRAICEAWHLSGASVVCMDIDATAAESLPEGIAFVRGDTSQADDCSNAVQFAVETFGALDVLVNNAAIQPREAADPTGRQIAHHHRQGAAFPVFGVAGTQSGHRRAHPGLDPGGAPQKGQNAGQIGGKYFRRV